MPPPPNDPVDMEDQGLVDEFIHWFRVYRAEGELNPAERDHFRKLAAEVRRRGLLDIDRIVRDA